MKPLTEKMYGIYLKAHGDFEQLEMRADIPLPPMRLLWKWQPAIFAKQPPLW